MRLYTRGRIFRLTDEQLGYLIDDSIKYIKEWKYYNRFDLFEKKEPCFREAFCWFTPSQTGLKWIIYLDEYCGYISNGHPLMVFLRKERSVLSKAVPIAVHPFRPFLLDEHRKPSEFTDEDLENVYEFIRRFYHVIVEYANKRIGYYDVVNVLERKPIYEGILSEMPTLKKDYTGLPSDIWIDGDRTVPHARRFKFKDKETNRSREWASMSISRTKPKHHNLDPKSKLTDADIDELKSFVIANYDVLMEIMKGDMKNFEEKEPFLVYPSRIKSIASSTTPVINIDIDDSSDKLLIVTYGDKYDKKFLDILVTKPLFKPYEKNIVYIPAYTMTGDASSFAQKILNEIYAAAKSIGCKANITISGDEIMFKINKLMRNIGKR